MGMYVLTIAFSLLQGEVTLDTRSEVVPHQQELLGELQQLRAIVAIDLKRGRDTKYVMSAFSDPSSVLVCVVVVHNGSVVVVCSRGT